MSIPFNESELQVQQEVVVRNPHENTTVKIYTTPVTPREGMKMLYQGKPMWQCCGNGVEFFSFCPAVNPDNVARGMVIDASGCKEKGGKDMFGIQWTYEPEVGGSMVLAKDTLATDMDELEEVLVWPDVSAWDWEGSAEANKNFLKEDRFNLCTFMNGWFERLIAMLGFENAAMALIDEDQKDQVHAFFNKLSDLYIEIFDRFMTYFPMIDGFNIHDDWGSQRETFFSPAVVEEMIVPYMRKVTDFIHSKGRYCDMHSCGQNAKQVPNYIKAGWDSWRPQPMNDIAQIYEQYGDQILIYTMPEPFDVKNSTEEEQRAAARAYAEKYCNPNKPSLLSLHAIHMMTPAFHEELYIQSRKRYCE